jgi:hypothetical protein
MEFRLQDIQSSSAFEAMDSAVATIDERTSSVAGERVRRIVGSNRQDVA